MILITSSASIPNSTNPPIRIPQTMVALLPPLSIGESLHTFSRAYTQQPPCHVWVVGMWWRVQPERLDSMMKTIAIRIRLRKAGCGRPPDQYRIEYEAYLL